MMAYTKDWSPRIPCRRNIGTKHHIKTLLHPSANKQTSATINIEFVNTMFRTEMHAWNCKSDIIIQFSFKRYLCNMVHIIGQWYLFVIWPIMTPGETLTLLLGCSCTWWLGQADSEIEKDAALQLYFKGFFVIPLDKGKLLIILSPDCYSQVANPDKQNMTRQNKTKHKDNTKIKALCRQTIQISYQKLVALRI